MVGIRDVARKAQVSPATVSRVLNADPTISVTQQTRQRILAAAKALNYDIQQRRYIHKRKPSIGVISTISQAAEKEDVYYHQLRLGMEEEARRLHLGMNRIYNLSDNPKQWRDLDQLGAMIVIGTVKKEAIAQLMLQNDNIVVVDYPDLQLPVDMVYADLMRMTQTILELFVESGHQRIAYIGGYKVDVDEQGTKQSSPTEKRFLTYQHFMRDHHLPSQAYLGGWSIAEGERLANELLKAKERPTALLVASDPLALGVYQALNKKLAIGQDLMIASFDNISAVHQLSPGLTTVQLPATAIGKTAVRLALERIDGIRTEPIIVTYPTNLVVRESFVPK
ncbi:MAG TPA: LacI family DNA-binding transcriptional regulator [Enterococcus columbae]|nr:LacI family DNA-binding transcriptional regulator [Enterococcus columbae]